MEVHKARYLMELLDREHRSSLGRIVQSVGQFVPKFTRTQSDVPLEGAFKCTVIGKHHSTKAAPDHQHLIGGAPMAPCNFILSDRFPSRSDLSR
jgi:hypothetical protein